EQEEQLGGRPAPMSIPPSTDAVFRKFFELAPDLMCLLSRDGRFEHVSPAVEALGYAVEDLVSLPLLELLHPDDRATTAAILAQLVEGAAVVGHENRCRSKDGSFRWFSWNARLAPGGHVVAIARD